MEYIWQTILALAKPNKGNMNTGISAVMPIGMASVNQKIAITSKTYAQSAFCKNKNSEKHDKFDDMALEGIN